VLVFPAARDGWKYVREWEAQTGVELPRVLDSKLKIVFDKSQYLMEVRRDLIREALAQMEFVPGTSQVSVEYLEKLMDREIDYPQIADECNVSEGYVRKLVFGVWQYVRSPLDSKAAWKHAINAGTKNGKTIEPGIYTVVKYDRKAPALKFIAPAETTDAQIQDAFHEVVCGRLVSQLQKNRLRDRESLDRKYFHTACELTRFLPWRVFPEPEDQAPAKHAAALICELLLRSVFADEYIELPASA
jgi:hypothetical protein